MEGRQKVTDEAGYGSDFTMAYAFVITSAISKGRIANLDVSAAKAFPGVLEVSTYKNTGDLNEVKFTPDGGGPTSSV